MHTYIHTYISVMVSTVVKHSDSADADDCNNCSNADANSYELMTLLDEDSTARITDSNNNNDNSLRLRCESKPKT